MASTIRVKRSSVAGKSPNTSILSTGELALNLADKKIYSSNGTSVFEIGSDSFSSKKTFYVSASGSSAYLFYGAGTGTDASQANSNPTLYLTRGETYTFSVNASGHPFYINTNNATGTGNQFANGVSGQGAQIGEVVFTVPMNAPNKLYYNCQYHSSMNGTIHIPSITSSVSSSPANTFSTINIAGQTDIVAEAAGDTLTFVAGAGVTLTSNSAADSVTIATTVQDDTVAMAIALG